MDKLFKLIKSLVFRIQVLKVVCLLMFIVIAFRLYAIQVKYSDDYQAYVNKTSTVALQRNVPRGVIYDRNMSVLVDNEAVSTITYQRYADVSEKEMHQIADKLADLIEVDFSKLTSRDLKDLYLEKFEDEAKELYTKEELKKYGDKKLYQLQLSRITDDMLSKLTDQDKEAHAIYINMKKGTNQTSNIIKKGATEEEVAIVSEHLESMPGVNTEVDWDRTYPSVAQWHPIYGRVSSYEQGLPAVLVDYYKAHDYQSNDRVGLSQLELYYEALLGGHKSQYLLTNDDDTSTYDEIYEGQRGYELVLTIDAELQAAVNDIVRDELLNAKKNSSTTKYLREAYIVMTNPNTGEVLAMTGNIIDWDDEAKDYVIYDNSLGTFQSSFTVGSVVKGATLLSGFKYGVTTPGQVVNDTKMYFKGGLVKGSWQTLGAVNDLTALQKSSNVYFFDQTIRFGGSYYSPYMALNLNLDVFDKYRSTFNEFGLGVSTGIDLPNESTGLVEAQRTSGKLLDFAIGQADLYTPMQLVQYVSTVATSGRRFAPTLVKEVYLPSNDDISGKQLVKGFAPNLLNVVELDQQYFDRVHQGFVMALQQSGGTGYSTFYKANYNPAGKTGTAQEYARDADGRYIKDANGEFIDVHSRTLIAYAPADKPEVALSVIVPQCELPSQSHPISLQIGERAMQAYFDLKKERMAAQNEVDNGETIGQAPENVAQGE
ncbi:MULTISPECIES: peptidoglycan D,D-transpeptidase FtsI family protein [unclassified Turicibacter]|uniref:peptidoglycan D,D-transpeptidase FtsI family protein n=1 Tax=unclassified Turicibacter TaxID=2638206 RepID=UPI0021D4D14F|nr:penicillin-binding protein 2 [Turicibacter sp. TA25]MCU7205057.1 penicillin-binding protein 2 [Turicibacter sp. TA25]